MSDKPAFGNIKRTGTSPELENSLQHISLFELRTALKQAQVIGGNVY